MPGRRDYGVAVFERVIGAGRRLKQGVGAVALVTRVAVLNSLRSSIVLT
jgi:hypothetical protein